MTVIKISKEKRSYLILHWRYLLLIKWLRPFLLYCLGRITQLLFIPVTRIPNQIIKLRDFELEQDYQDRVRNLEIKWSRKVNATDKNMNKIVGDQINIARLNSRIEKSKIRFLKSRSEFLEVRIRYKESGLFRSIKLKKKRNRKPCWLTTLFPTFLLYKTWCYFINTF